MLTPSGTDGWSESWQIKKGGLTIAECWEEQDAVLIVRALKRYDETLRNTRANNLRRHPKTNTK